MEQDFLKRLTRVIDVNIADSSFGADDLSREMGMSHSNLLRKVHSYTGKSINQLIREIRLRKAWELLNSKELTVSEAAFKLGFSSPSYFTTCFRNFYGYPPGELKNLKTADRDPPVVDSGKKMKDQELKPDRDADNRKNAKLTKLKIAFLTVIVLSIVVPGFFLTPLLLRSAEPIDKSIAILPLKLMNYEPEKQRDADAIYELIVQHLSRISDLRVIPAQSMERYRNSSKTINEIGKEVAVRNIGRGSYKTYGDSLTLTFRLFDSRSGRMIWDTIFSDSRHKGFSIESNVAQGIAGRIQVAMTPLEKRILWDKPTSDTMAWECYLSAREYQKQDFWSHHNTSAIQWYEKAVRIDPDFALAWVGLASCYREIFASSWDRSDEVISKAKEYLDRAMSLAPNLKEVHFEEAAYYYQIPRDYKKSLGLFEKLRVEYPSDSQIIFMLGCIYRRMGQYKKTLKNLDQSIALNPAESTYWSTKAQTERALRNYDQAENSMNRAIDLNPTVWGRYEWMFLMFLKNGQIDRATEYLINHKNNLPDIIFRIFNSTLESLDGNYNKAIQWLDSLPPDPINGQCVYYTKNRQFGLIYRLIQDTVKAALHFRAERDFLLKEIERTGGDERMFCSLGICYAGLGMKPEAKVEAGKALDLINIYKDPYSGYVTELQVVQILVMLGEYDQAMEKLDLIMGRNGDDSAEILKLDPFWNPVRNHPRFIRIINNPKYQVN